MNRSTLYPLGSSLELEDLLVNPHPHLHRLREAEPVSWVEPLNAWLVTDYALAVQVMRQAPLFTVDHPGFTTAQVVGHSMLSQDGVAHQQHRSPFEYPFRKKEVYARFRSFIYNLADKLVSDLSSKSEADMLNEFAAPMAVNTMMFALGLKSLTADKLLDYYSAIVTEVTQLTTGAPKSKAGQEAFVALREALLPSVSDPSSLLGSASGKAQDLSDEQLISNAAVLLFGGIETTEGMLANTLYLLLEESSRWESLNHDPARLPLMIEECLRLEPAASVVDRFATEDTVLGTASIREGDLVRVSLTGANRDPSVFTQPDTFDPTRKNVRSHLAFAQGPHVCLGLHLARLETTLALEMMLKRSPSVKLDPTKFNLAQPHGLVFRKPKALWLNWH